MAKPMVICENLVKIYKVADLEVVALQGLDLTVQKGEMLGIVGPSGCGKTTLLNIIGGLDRPSAGNVVVDRQNLLKLSDAELNLYRRHRVGFVWQQAGRNLIPYLTVLENVELPMSLSGLRGKACRAWAEELLEMVGLSHRHHHKLAQLSGGEQQRAAIAVALANKPPLLLADEPTGELDSATSREVYETLHHLREIYGLTVIVVTHDPEISGLADRVVAIRDGKTSAERVRIESTPSTPDEEETLYSEYVVLDSAGRLQVPKELLEKFGIKDKARLEPVEEGILIRPVEDKR